MCLQPCQQAGLTLSSGKTTQSSAAMGLPHHPAILEVHQQQVSCATSPKCDIGDAVRDQRNHQAVKMDSHSCWQSVYIRSSFTMFWCTLENWPMVQLATREDKGHYGQSLQLFHQASAMCLFLCDNQEPRLLTSVTSHPSKAFN